MFEKILKWYKQKLWTKEMVFTAMSKGIISYAEYEKIIEEE